MAIKKTTLHPENDSEIELYPKTSVDQVTGLMEYAEQQINNTFNTMHDINAVWTLRNSLNVAHDKGIFYYSNNGAPQSILYQDAKNLKEIGLIKSRGYDCVISYNTFSERFEALGINPEPSLNSVAVRTTNGTLKAYDAIDDDDCVTLKQLKTYLHRITLVLTPMERISFSFITHKATPYELTDEKFYSIMLYMSCWHTTVLPSTTYIPAIIIATSMDTSSITFVNSLNNNKSSTIMNIIDDVLEL